MDLATNEILDQEGQKIEWIPRLGIYKSGNKVEIKQHIKNNKLTVDKVILFIMEHTSFPWVVTEM